MTQTKAADAASTSSARRAARLAAVQTLYQQEYGQELKVGLHLDEGHEAVASDTVLMQHIIHTATQRRLDIDEILGKTLDPAWPLARLELVLRAILRAGTGELLENPQVPTAFLITDYVDVAHAFFAGKEPGLVNAVLDRIAKLVRG